jgi:hypothetical protein
MESIPRMKVVSSTPFMDHSNNAQHGLYQAVPYGDEYSVGDEWAHNSNNVTKQPFSHLNTPTMDSTDEIRLPATNQSHLARTKNAEWRINWLGEPLQMPLYTLCGISQAPWHHFFFSYLNDRQSFDEGMLFQHVVKQIGNAFVFLVLVVLKPAVLKPAILVAYNQYIWTIFRRRSPKVAVIDNSGILFQLRIIWGS